MATEVATLQFKADTTQLKSANDELAKTAQAGVRAEDAARKMGTELKKAANDSINPIQKVTSGISGLQSALVALAGSAVVGQIVSITNQFTDLNSRLINATGSAEGATEAFAAISETARRTYSSLQQTAQGFLQNNLVLTELGYTTREQLVLMDALNNSLVISGAKGDQAAMIMGAFGRAMAEGSLKGQELNLMMTYSARTVQALADGLGVTTIELRRMVAAGEIDATRMFQALTSQQTLLATQAGAMSATIADSAVLFKNAMFEMIGTFDQASGASNAIATALVSLSDNMDDLAFVAGVVGAVYVAKFVPGMLSAARAQLALTTTTTAYNHSLMVMQTTLTRVTLAQNLAAISTTALTRAYALIGGPMGALIITGAAMYAMWTRNAEAVDFFTASIDRGRQSVESAKNANMGITAQVAALERAMVDNGAELENTNFLFGENSKESQALRVELRTQEGQLRVLKQEQEKLNIAIAKGTEGTEAFVGPIQRMNEETETSVSLASQLMASIADEIYMLGLSNREREIRANLMALGANASAQEVAAITAATNALYDQRQAMALIGTEGSSTFVGPIQRINDETEAQKEAALERFETIVRYNKMENELKDKANKQQLERQREQTSQLLAFEDVLLQGKNSALGEAYRIGVNYADKEKRTTAGTIISKSYEAAMKAYAALSAVPIIGPALGAAAAAGIIAAGVSYSAKSLAGRALGGQVRGGESYVVGERGPEILTMGSASGKIIPNSSITQAQATGTINNTANVTFSITANDTRGFDELLLKRRGMIASLVQSSLNNLGRSI
jgi:tape measure domain-containing protein